jgi:RNA recognition motif-containing protein
MNIYISNLDSQTKNEDLQRLFEQFGKVTSASVIMDKYTGTSRGFAFVEMDDAGGSKAIEQLNNTQLNGKSISVSVARPRESRGSSGGGSYNKKW